MKTVEVDRAKEAQVWNLSDLKQRAREVLGPALCETIERTIQSSTNWTCEMKQSWTVSFMADKKGEAYEICLALLVHFEFGIGETTKCKVIYEDGSFEEVLIRSPYPQVHRPDRIYGRTKSKMKACCPESGGVYCRKQDHTWELVREVNPKSVIIDDHPYASSLYY